MSRPCPNIVVSFNDMTVVDDAGAEIPSPYLVIEPEDRSWIIYTDAAGRPEFYWPKRQADGAVVGDPVRLT